MAPTIENREARFDFQILDTIEVGISLTGSEVKSIRNGRITLANGFVMARLHPREMTLHEVHIDEYPQALPQHQHEPRRIRRLLAHAKEIERLAIDMKAKGTTLVPLKVYFSKGRVKVLVGIALGRKKGDKREALRAKEDRKDMARATTRRR
ncbi:MAG: SsrA-binding protein SmpB [Planctomycetota bacterium]|nr:SsrA-binding protein SmpB [Planctomycetota bacterium]